MSSYGPEILLCRDCPPQFGGSNFQSVQWREEFFFPQEINEWEQLLSLAVSGTSFSLNLTIASFVLLGPLLAQ